MTKFQQALREELAGRLKAGKIRSTRDLSEMMTTMFWEAVREVLLVETDQQLGRHRADSLHADMQEGQDTKGQADLFSNQDLQGKLEFAGRADFTGRTEIPGAHKESRLGPEIEAHVLSLYSHGMSTGDIENCIREFYGVEISKTAISRLADWVVSYIGTWKNRPLEKVYLVVWLDRYLGKVRQDGRIVDRAIDVAAGLNSRGQKEVLGMWSSEKEGPPPWLKILQNLKSRGVGDILLISTGMQDGLPETLKKAFSQTRPPTSIVIRLSRAVRQVPSRDRKAIKAAVKAMSEAPDLETANRLLGAFEEHWAGKYTQIVAVWRDNRDQVTAFFELPLPIRKIIGSIDLAEIISKSIPRHTHSKTIPANDQAAEATVYMSLMKDEKKWSGPLKDWPSVLVLFIHIFGERTEPNPK